MLLSYSSFILYLCCGYMYISILLLLYYMLLSFYSHTPCLSHYHYCQNEFKVVDEEWERRFYSCNRTDPSSIPFPSFPPLNLSFPSNRFLQNKPKTEFMTKRGFYWTGEKKETHDPFTIFSKLNLQHLFFCLHMKG